MRAAGESQRARETIPRILHQTWKTEHVPARWREARRSWLAAHPGWDSRNETICKSFGRQWYEEKRSALLIVPSIPARLERNFLVNPTHPDARGITHTLPAPVWWDERLYGHN